MMSAKFTKIAAICTLLTALTTVCIHWLPGAWSDVTTFEQRAELRNNTTYLAYLWIAIVHCFLVVISMYAIKLYREKATPALVSLGFVAFVGFAFTELLRTSINIFAVNRGWRAGYAGATDEAARETFREAITVLGGVNDAFFFIFFTCFTLGTLCYGLSLARSSGWSQKIGWMMILWAALNIPGLINTVTGGDHFGSLFSWVGPYFQPLARAAIGVWMWNLKSDE
jgi:hypothetical protein